jgi:hypothetical protein
MNPVDEHFVRRNPVVREIYDEILRVSRGFGEFEEQPKKTSIHLARKSAFAGIATRKDALVLTIKSDTDVRDRRLFKREQVSAHRWHLEVKLETPDDIDVRLRTLLERAYELAG